MVLNINSILSAITLNINIPDIAAVSLTSLGRRLRQLLGDF